MFEYQDTDQYRAFLRLLARIKPASRKKAVKDVRYLTATLALGYATAKICYMIHCKAQRGETFTVAELLELTKDMGRHALGPVTPE